MKESNFIKGKKGEDEAVQYLQERSYKIIERNWRFSRNEIDIIALDDDQLVIVEVKYRENTYHADPQDSVDWKKRRILVETADSFINSSNYDLDVRFDILAISGKEKLKILHIKDAFDANEV